MKNILIALLLFVGAVQAENRLVVSKKSNVAALLENEQVTLIAPISIGADNITPTGRYSVVKMERHTTSRKFSEKLGIEIPMSDCLRLTGLGKGDSRLLDQEGVCFHESFTGTASRGCIRADRATADWVYGKAYIGMKIDIVESFEGALSQFDQFDRTKIELHGNSWKPLPNAEVANVLRRLNQKGGGNKAGRYTEYPIDLNAIAVILGSQLVTKGLTEKGNIFEGINPSVKAFIARLPAKVSGAKRYSTVQSDGTKNPEVVGYLISGGDFFLWYPLEQINPILEEMGLNPLR